MAFLNEVGKFAKTMTDKAGEMVDITRLNAKIGTLKGEIVALKTQIGEYYWSKFEAGEPCPTQLGGVCDEIRKQMEAIAGVEAEIAAIRGGEGQGASGVAGVFCQSCGAKQTTGAKFCGSCGGKL